MASTTLGIALHRLCRSWHGLSAHRDGDLLESFISRGDEKAFEVLLRRHAPMVMGVCRRVLGNEADAEDAFQATFLVLVRKAAAIRPRGMVGNWLYGVAHTTALKARAMNAKRSAKERERAEGFRHKAAFQAWEALHEVLDQELKALPDLYRSAIVLCDLEGRPLKEAARQLGCPLGTLGARLTRGRSMLAKRLGRHGFGVTAGAVAGALAQNAASAGVPANVLATTIKAATLVAAGQATAAGASLTGVVPAKVVALTEGVLQAMLLSKIKVLAGAFAIIAAIGLGVGQLFTGALLAHPLVVEMATASTVVAGDDAKEAKPKPGAEDGAVEKELKRLQGNWGPSITWILDGQPSNEDDRIRHSTVIRGDKMIGLTDGKEKVTTLMKIDPAKKPKEIDLIYEDGPTKGKAIKGIYKLDGDLLTFCYGDLDKGRPTEFVSESGSGRLLTVHRREKE
ncbi:MAG: sigma-70 family RNA polymerase sigma factor [Planctomycetes bacterium]|nr:sigma-70 family RNA polymerase sigma factor [Planctomycetota bacterium]